MRKCTTKLPTLKELEVTLFRNLQQLFADGMVQLLETLDEYLMNNRDHALFRLKDQREVCIDTAFGTVRFKRRLYQERVTGEFVFLLDRMLSFKGQNGLSPFLEDVAVEFATQGPSYRESAKWLERLLGYRVLSHETIRKKLIARAEQDGAVLPETKQKAPRVLFVEVDGLYTSLQRHRRSRIENRMAVVHEGWEQEEKRVRLKHKRHYLHTGCENFWEGFGEFLVAHYEIDEQRG